jgi:hypothetical protein
MFLDQFDYFIGEKNLEKKDKYSHFTQRSWVVCKKFMYSHFHIYKKVGLKMKCMCAVKLVIEYMCAEILCTLIFISGKIDY